MLQMQPFVVNSHNRIVFPSNFVPELDLSVMHSLEQLDKVIRRDFEVKAPTGTDILKRVEEGAYSSRYELLRDLALNLFWTNRFSLTLYEKRPTRWADVPRHRPDVFLPIVKPWQDGDRKVAAVKAAYETLPATWDGEVEDRIFGTLFDVFGHRKHHATDLPTIKPTVAEILSDPANLTFRLPGFDPDFPVFSHRDILDCNEEVPELEALTRWSKVLHNQYPWDRAQAELVEVGQLQDDDIVVVMHPRNQDVGIFLERLQTGGLVPAFGSKPRKSVQPIRPYPATKVRTHFKVMPKVEAMAVARGELSCSNDDVVRNSAYNWSPMSADDIFQKTGVLSRCFTEDSLEEMALKAAKAALAKSGRGPEEIGAVIVACCSSPRYIPSVATWISGQLGIYQTHASFDVIAACAGMAYGFSDATRILQEVQRPVLLVCAEKFSDKGGNVRPSRMLFGDGAAAFVIGVAPEGELPDIEYLQTYASGPAEQVNSILWPNPEFDNNLTVNGPFVKQLAARYLGQMIDEIKALPDPDGIKGSLLESIDLVVPHQANKPMVIDLAAKAGISEDNLYFNIETMGNVSSASIPIAIHDAVRDGVIKVPTRIFAPGFGAGSVAGYCVMRIDPAVVAIEGEVPAEADEPVAATATPSGPSSDHAQQAFG
jgi:3-oxoacyl-(acyl-carrier-protein) synthase III